jgi:hypothetical protein
MQRNNRIPTGVALSPLELQSRTEAALQELERMINNKVADYEITNPKDTIVRIDRATNHLFVYNTASKTWAEFEPVS